VISILLVPSVLVGLYFLWALNRKPRLLATIRIEPSGLGSTTIVPEENDPDTLMRLVLVYGSKVRWILNNEPEGARQTFEGILDESVDKWCAVAVRDLRSDTELRIVTEGMARGELPGAVARGEDFRVKYFEGRPGYVVNSIPVPGLSSNLAWHFLHLLQEVRNRLSQDDRHRTVKALYLWSEVARSADANDKTMAGLKRLTVAAENALARATA
jgi:hypothetical protein